MAKKGAVAMKFAMTLHPPVLCRSLESFSGLVATCTRSPCLEHHMQVMSVNVRSIWGSHHLHSMQIVVGARYGAATYVEILVCGHMHWV